MLYTIATDRFYGKYPRHQVNIRAFGFIDRIKALGLALLGMLCGTVSNSGAAGTPVQSVRLAWSPVSYPAVAGYKIYYGARSGAYTNVVNAGNTTGTTIPNLASGVTYYFAATVYNAVGLESIPSSEISYTVTASTVTRLFISARAGTPVVLSGIGQAGHIYEIQAKTVRGSWSVLGNVTAATDGSFQYTDSQSIDFSSRLYRARDTQP